MIKTCSICKEEAPVEYFGLRGNSTTVYRSECRGCRNYRVNLKNNPEVNRTRKYKYRYGITIHDYNVLYTKQSGGCAICSVVTESNLHVDHDHCTGKVRGLLCSPCNTGIGKLKDSVENLKSAIKYLIKHNGGN